MKKLIVLTCTLSLLTACGDSIEKKAGEKLAAARAAFEHNDYNEAKLQIDSIKILYPKAFDTRKEGIKLMQQVELKEQQESLVYLDSMLQVKQKEFEAIKNKYTFEKNEEYQKIGNYFWPTQTVEKNLHRSFLRFQVNEQGVMTLTSIYCRTKQHPPRSRQSDSTGRKFLPKPQPPTTATRLPIWEKKSKKPTTKWEKTATSSVSSI